MSATAIMNPAANASIASSARALHRDRHVTANAPSRFAPRRRDRVDELAVGQSAVRRRGTPDRPHHTRCSASRSAAVATAFTRSGAAGNDCRLIFQLFGRTRACSSSPRPSSRYSHLSDLE